MFVKIWVYKLGSVADMKYGLSLDDPYSSVVIINEALAVIAEQIFDLMKARGHRRTPAKLFLHNGVPYESAILFPDEWSEPLKYEALDEREMADIRNRVAEEVAKHREFCQTHPDPTLA